MQNIHLLPLPDMESVLECGDNNVQEMVGEDGDVATVPPECKELVSTLNGRKKNVKKHLANW
jgi:hypothetical protein